jgi:phosphatidylserine/phosphatidylglycerophosphate/cardiolipin synthase-like enzyme
MGADHNVIAIEAGRLASALPFALLDSLAAAIMDCSVSDFPAAKTRLLQGVAHAEYRGLVAAFLDRWSSQAGSIPAPAVSLALLTAAHAERTERDEMSVEVVWTGPESGTAPFRRTEQAIRQVLDSATQRITLISYAVYKIPFICEALVRAARRGVRITVVVETPDRVAGEHEYNTLLALGPDVAACCSVLYWPKEKRPHNDVGKTGILHVKCVVADGRWLFLSSANLTEYAFTINMELGVLITGGSLPIRIERHFQRLIDVGILDVCARAGAGDDRCGGDQQRVAQEP